jgi:hypothetical protein
MSTRLFDILHSYDLMNNYTIFDKFINKIQNKEKNMLKYEQIIHRRKSLNQKRSNSIACMRSVEYIEHLEKMDKSIFYKRSWSKTNEVNEIYFDSIKPCMNCEADINLDNKSILAYLNIENGKIKKDYNWICCSSCNQFTLFKAGIYIGKPNDVKYSYIGKHCL